MRITLIVVALVTLVSPVMLNRAEAAPKPAPVPITWELDIKTESPMLIEVSLRDEVKPQRYWYMRYTLTNKTAEKQIFVPEFLLYTDTGQVLRAGKRIPSTVFNAIKKRHNEPLLKNMISMTGVILTGADNTKKGVAIWPDFDPKAGRFDVFIGGLSGETKEISLPRPVGDMSKIILSKTLNFTFMIDGEAAARPNTPVRQRSQKWLMR